MKRLLLSLIVLAFLVPAVQAGGPGPYKIYFPAVGAGCDMTSTSLATLEISDGTVTIDLLRGNIHLKDWDPAIPQLKSGGIWQDSALATGRRLVDRRFGNVSDSLSLVVSSPNQDDTIREIGDLLHLLEKARDFTASSWQGDPVWLKRQAGCETNPTFSLIYDYKIPQLSNPYAAPFAAATQLATMNNFTLSMEHSIWLSCRPGAGECVQASGVQAWAYKSLWQLNTSQPANYVTNIIKLDSLPNRMLAGEEDEVWRTDTGGAVWTASAVPPAMHVDTMVEDAAGDIYAAGQTGIWRSQDGGDNWVQRSAARGSAYPAGLVLTIGDDGALYLADGPNGFYKSTDGGATWNLLFADIGAMSILNTRYGLIAASTLTGVYRSTDNGLNWTSVFTSEIIYMISDPGDGYVYLGTIQAVSVPTLYRSPDGINWSIAATFPTLPAVTALRNMILASDGVYYLSFGSGDIWISRDALAWQYSTNIGTNAFSLVEYTPLGAIYSGEQGDIYSTISTTTTSMGNAPSCSDQVFVANKQNVANLTHIFIADGGVFSGNLLPLTFPGHTHLLPAAPAINDAVYFGIDSTIADTGPFESLVFDLYDIISFTGSYTITWEYVTAVGPGPGFVLTWSPLTVQDGTNLGTGAFRASGVSSVHWSPTGWVDTGGGSVNGISGWWVRARVSALAGTMTSPSQQNRNIYTTVLPYADIAAAQVGGDIPALAQVKLHNRSDKDGRAGSGPDLWDNRVIVGGRSYDRGPTFTAYLNASDEQNPTGVTVTLGANTTVPAGISGITGKLCTWAAALADTTFVDRVTFTLGPTIARDFYGTFHAFLRANVTAGSSGDIHARLQVRTGSGGVTLTSVDDYLKGTTDYEVLDFGRVSIPASGLLSFDDLGDSTVLAVQFRNDSGAARTVYVHDLILIPVDECAVDATDYANITLSVVGRTSSTPHLLDFDSLTYHKIDLRTLARTADGNGFVTSVYVPGGGPMVLQANARQRLWVFAMQTSATGTTYVWLAPPWIVHSVQVLACERWLGLRGDR